MNYKFILAILLFSSADLSVFAQQKQADTTDYMESNVIPLTGKEGISWQTKKGDFLFKPYMFLQTKAQFQYYDNDGLDISEKDKIFNTGFGIPNAILGFSGKAFGKVTFNLALNTVASGGALVNQAWFDINIRNEMRFRIGKFKTPFNQAYLVQLGQTLFPALPSSLTTTVNLPFDINSTKPMMSTGFDVGIEMHGVIKNTWDYQVGLFNGTGITVNDPQNTFSDDLHIPDLLYAARLAWMPYGPMPLHQGNPDDLNSTKIMIAASASYNVEANYESSNDFRAGLEFSYLKNKLYLSAEGYLLNMDFVERQQVSPNYLFWGAYAQGGYFVTTKLQPMLRLDWMKRNSTTDKGLIYMPAIGFNYYLAGYNLKIQTMYQLLCQTSYADSYAKTDDNSGMPKHQVMVMFQFSF